MRADDSFVQQGPGAMAQRRQLTVLFCDLVGATAIASSMDPEDYRVIIRAYHGTVAEIVVRFGGHVAQFLGDGVLAYFGFPIAHEDDAERAVRAALEANRAIAGLSSGAGVALAARAGIATGTVVVDPAGAGTSASEPIATGPAPNLAARLQAVAAPHGVVVSESTRLLLGKAFALRSLGALDLKGFPRPVRAWDVDGEVAGATRFEARAGGFMPPIVGREPELRALVENWQVASAGEGRALLIVGEAGLGKSRVCHEFLRRIEGQAFELFELQCSALASASPLQPLRPHLARLGAQDTEAEQPNPSDRIRSTQVRILAWIEQACEAAPVLVLAEDIHWSDPATEDLLAMLAERIGELPAMLVATMRPDHRPRNEGLAWLPRLTVEALGPRDARALAGSVAEALGPHGRLSDAVLDEIVRRTDGVPLYIEEFTRALVESAHEGPGRAPDSVAVPATLRDLLTARLDRRGPASGLAQAASVIGRDFHLRLLREVADVDEATLRLDLQTLVSAGLIVPAQAGGPDAYSFRHALIRDTAYTSMLRERRTDLHRRVADALESAVKAGEEVSNELLAFHLQEAGAHRRAFDCWEAAAREAARIGADREAASHCRAAIAIAERWLPEEATGDRLADLRVALGNALLNAEGYGSPVTRECWDEILAAAAASRQPGRQLAILCGVSPTLYARGRFGDHIALMHSIDVGALRGSRAAAWHGLVGISLMMSGRLAEAGRHFALSVRPWPASDEPPFLGGGNGAVVARLYAARCQAYLGDIATGDALLDDAMRIARAVEHPPTLCWALMVRASMAFNRGDDRTVQASVDEYEPVAERLGLHTRVAVATIQRGLLAIGAGTIGVGVDLVWRGLKSWRRHGGAFHCSEHAAVAAHALLLAGEQAAASELVAFGETIQAETEERLCAAELLRLRARLAELDGDMARAEALCEEALATATRSGNALHALRAATDLARLAREPGLAGRFRVTLARLCDGFRGADELPDLMAARAMLAGSALPVGNASQDGNRNG